MVDIRLFIALNFPDSILDKIAGITREVEANSLRGRFVERQNIHLTLEFLGEVGEDRMPLIKKVIDRLEYAPFSLFLGKIGYFKREDGSVCWIGVERNETLLSLQEQLHIALESCGFKLESRVFTPHITLGRKVRLKTGFNSDRLNAIASGLRADIGKVDLMKSEFKNGKTFYSILYSKPLP